MTSRLRRSELVGNMSFVTQEQASADVSAETMKVGRADLAGGAKNAFAFSWQNPESTPVMVTGGLIYVSSAGAAGSTMDIGSAADDATHGDDLLVGAPLDLATPNAIAFTGVALLDAFGGATDHVTGQILSAAATALEGKVFIFYVSAA